MKYRLVLVSILFALLLTGCSKKENSIVNPPANDSMPKLLGTWAGNYPLPPHVINESIVFSITYQSNDTVKGYGVIGDSADHVNEHLPYTTFTHVGIIQNDSLFDFLYPAGSTNPLFYEAQITDSTLQGYLWLTDVRGDMAGIQFVAMTR
jgi:hypothetical protein